MPKIFISYRREDTPYEAVPVRDRLAEHFGKSEIFFDVDAIPLGHDFSVEIDRRVGACDYFIALIGRSWLTVRDEDGQRRLDDPNDWVRLEIEAALKRQIPVIPLLFHNVRMPKRDQLPEALAELPKRQAHPIRPLADFNHDVDRLIRELDEQEALRLETEKHAQEKRQRDAKAPAGAVLKTPPPERGMDIKGNLRSQGLSDAADAPFTIEDVHPGESAEGNAVAVAWNEDEEAEEADSKDPAYLIAQFVHEHPTTGFLADLVIPEKASESIDQIAVVLSHKLLGALPRKIRVHVPAAKEDPVQYLRLTGLIQGYPVMLRVHWLERLKLCPAFENTLGSNGLPLVQIVNSNEQVVTHEAAGILLGEKFTSLIPLGLAVPVTVTKRLRTKHDKQKAVAVTPAIRTADGIIRKFTKLRVRVLPAPAGIPWVECACRVDPDGRCTTYLRNPLHGMRIEDLLGPSK